MSDKSYVSKLARPSPLFIGIDLGTSGCRAIAIDTTGKIKAQSEHPYSRQEDHQQQTPQNWWLAIQSVLQDISTKVNQQHIQSIAVDGTSGTVMLCNDAGKPVSPALMYNDQRAKDQVAFLKQYVNKDAVVLNPTSGLAKALWLIEHYQPNENFHIVHQADWIAGQLCRRFDFSDVNNSLKTGYDPINKNWPLWLRDLFNELKIAPECLPKVSLPGSYISNIDLQVASQLGLPIDVDIIAGTTDSTAAFIACSKTKPKPGDAVTSLGSTLVLKVVSDIPVNDPAHGVYSQPLGDQWLVGGASNSGGAVLRYYFSDKQMINLSKQFNPDISTNLDYYPLLQTGERFPVNDPNLAPRLSPKAENDAIFFQGLLEGIADIEQAGYQLLERLGAPYPSSVITTGGGAVNKAWQHIRENKLKVPIVVAKNTTAAYGAAKLAASKYTNNISGQR